MASASVKPVVHLELHTGDLAGACAFYEDLFHWRPERIRSATGSYLAMALGGTLGGGVVECAARRPVWLPYVEVTDIAAITTRASELGAAILLEPREGPVGRRSVVAAPAAGEVALWEPKRRRSRP